LLKEKSFCYLRRCLLTRGGRTEKVLLDVRKGIFCKEYFLLDEESCFELRRFYVRKKKGVLVEKMSRIKREKFLYVDKMSSKKSKVLMGLRMCLIRKGKFLIMS
jgi:hypothetical protein